MKNAMFFSDIQGTLTGDASNDLQMKLFISNLERLKKVDNIDNFYLSLISSNHMTDIRNFFDTHIEPILKSSSIKLGPLISSKHVFLDNQRNRFDSGKAYQMYKISTDEHFQNGNSLNKAYFADDSFFNHKIARFLFEKKLPDTHLQSFILNSTSESDRQLSEYISDNRGIYTLNSLLNDYILDKDKKNSIPVKFSNPFDGR